MSARRILTLLFAAFVLTEARWHTQKREVTSICDHLTNNHSKVSCYCVKNNKEADHIKSADCFVTVEGVKSNDHAWDSFEQLKSSLKITLTNSKGIALQYIPTQALKHLKALVQLTITYGNIERVHRFAFANLSKIEEIELRDSQIQILEPHSFVNHKELREIKLDKNNIVEINRNVFKDLPSLEKLYLTENQITTIHDQAFVHLASLKELEINMNRLFSLNSETFSGLKKLQKLDLSSNNLEVIGDNTFYPLKNLLSLNLDGNKIQMLDAKAFHGLVKLRFLSLAHNKLRNIENDEVFVGLPGMVTLSLRGNDIKELNTKAMAPLLNNFYREESHLDVEDNQFPCECKLDWFMHLMNHTRSKILKNSLENFKCLPDAKLKEMWNKLEDSERNSEQMSDVEDSGQLNTEYEYYDDTQLNGKLFYIDIRDLINCDKNKPKVEVTTQRIAILVTASKENKVTNPATPSKTSVTHDPEHISTSKETNTKPVVSHINHGVLDLSETETETTPKMIDMHENEIMHNNKQNSYTTSRLVNVSAKPINVYDNMAADEAKPDKLKAQRSLQAELKDMPSSGHKNVGCVALILLLSFRLFH